VHVTVDVLEAGPARGQLRVASMYRWPERHGGALVDVEVTTVLELRAGEPFVRVETGWVNRTRDQRVRVVFALPAPAASSRAECAFTVVERGLTAEGGATELGLATFPAKRFVQAGGLTVAHDRVLEYELVDIDDTGAHALALTLARGTGFLSQLPMKTRPLPAGPFIAMEGSQLQKPVAVRYAVQAGAVNPYALVDDAFLPLAVGRAGGGARAQTGQALAVDGAEVSSLRRVGGRLELRVFNPSDQTATVDIGGRHGWLVDLRGRPVEPFSSTFALGPQRIATAVIDEC
jgi:hypothetical protein